MRCTKCKKKIKGKVYYSPSCTDFATRKIIEKSKPYDVICFEKIYPKDLPESKLWWGAEAVEPKKEKILLNPGKFLRAYDERDYKVIPPIEIDKLGVVSPKYIAEKGIVYPVSKDQIQQNGIDVTIGKIYLLNKGSSGRIFKNEKAQLVDKKTEIESEVIMGDYEKYFYNLQPLYAYEVITNEKVKVPKDMCAWVIIRSSLNRCGCSYSGGLYDSGYEGPIGGVLRPLCRLEIEKDARIAQIVFWWADSYKLYKGRYHEGGK